MAEYQIHITFGAGSGVNLDDALRLSSSGELFWFLDNLSYGPLDKKLRKKFVRSLGLEALLKFDEITLSELLDRIRTRDAELILWVGSCARDVIGASWLISKLTHVKNLSWIFLDPKDPRFRNSELFPFSFEAIEPKFIKQLYQAREKMIARTRARFIALWKETPKERSKSLELQTLSLDQTKLITFEVNSFDEILVRMCGAKFQRVDSMMSAWLNHFPGARDLPIAFFEWRLQELQSAGWIKIKGPMGKGSHRIFVKRSFRN